LALMKPTAYLINTSRGAIVEEDALLAALGAGLIAGAGVDVFDREPLPSDHGFRSEPRMLATPHIGYVTREGYRVFFAGVVESIAAWQAGNPIRVVT
jgi:phosphoglycerate dehydrogenase-like enzyme